MLGDLVVEIGFFSSRFSVEHVSSVPEALGLLEVVIQVIIIDDVASGSVNENSVGLHFGKKILVDHAFGVGSGRHMETHDVRVGKEVVKAAGVLEAD